MPNYFVGNALIMTRAGWRSEHRLCISPAWSIDGRVTNRLQGIIRTAVHCTRCLGAYNEG